jgi:hypothetical protein
VRIVVATTLWTLVSCFLIFPLAGLPAFMHRLAMTLIVGELLALAFWYYGGADFGHTIATVDVPLSAAALVAFAAGQAAFTHRRQLAAAEQRRQLGSG